MAIAAIVINGALYVVLAFTRFLPFVALVLACVGMFQGVHMALTQDDRAAAGAGAYARARDGGVDDQLGADAAWPAAALGDRRTPGNARGHGDRRQPEPVLSGVFVAFWGRQLWTLTSAGMHAADRADPSGATDPVSPRTEAATAGD